MASRKKGVPQERILHRKLVELWQRGQSRLCEVRGSEIHGRGVYATTFIPEGERIIEYVGEMIDKEESERRGQARLLAAALVAAALFVAAGLVVWSAFASAAASESPRAAVDWPLPAVPARPAADGPEKHK